MHAASLRKSQRLQRVLTVLKHARQDDRPLSTMDIIQQARVCAVNSIIAELRANGYDIRCTRDAGTWYYQYQLPQEATHE